MQGTDRLVSHKAESDLPTRSRAVRGDTRVPVKMEHLEIRFIPLPGDA